VGFKVEFGKHDIPAEMTAGQTVSADVTIKKASSKTWPSKPDSGGRNAVNFSYIGSIASGKWWFLTD
jgi:hypothetical protein